MTGRKAANGFPWNGTLGLFQQHGFDPGRQIGKHRWVARRTVTAGGSAIFPTAPVAPAFSA